MSPDLDLKPDAYPRRNLVPFVQLHLFIFVLLVSAGISVALQPHRFAGSMDLLSMTAMSVIMYLSLYYLNYAQQPSSALPSPSLQALSLALTLP